MTALAFAESIALGLSRSFPTLRITDTKETITINGAFPVLDEGEELDRYELEIEVTSDFPKRLPKIVEIGGRIPRVRDRHVDPKDGAFCVMLPDDFWFQFPKGMSFEEYLAGPVRNFLLGQTLVSSGEPWPWGEWKHGKEGVLQFYKERFGIADAQLLRRFLVLATSVSSPSATWPCPCGSSRLGRCQHRATLEAIRTRVPRHVLQEALKES